MLYTRWLMPGALRDQMRLQQNATPQELPDVRACLELLVRILRYDPQLQGQVSTIDSSLRRLFCGPVGVIFRTRPPEDRTVEIWGFFRNPGWAP
jgi:hypothetical protein